LGILAGDFLKAARDLGLPVVGVGLRWARGYSRQRIGDDGTPVDEFPEYSADFLTDTGARVRVRVAEREVEARVWRTERWGNAPWSPRTRPSPPATRSTRSASSADWAPAAAWARRRCAPSAAIPST